MFEHKKEIGEFCRAGIERICEKCIETGDYLDGMLSIEYSSLPEDEKEELKDNFVKEFYESMDEHKNYCETDIMARTQGLDAEKQLKARERFVGQLISKEMGRDMELEDEDEIRDYLIKNL